MKKQIILKTRGDYIRAHRKLWRWLAENPKIKGEFSEKRDWPEWEFNGGRYKKQLLDCFLCNNTCSHCPIKWPSPREYICGGLFGKWYYAKTSKFTARYAKMIAELPVRRIRK